MPRITDDITICGRSDQACVSEVELQFEMKINTSFICNCLPGCYAISYEAELSMTPILGSALYFRDGDKINTNTKRPMVEKDLAVLHVYFRESLFRSQKKEELIGFTEFLCKKILIVFY